LRHDASLGRSPVRTLPYVPRGGVATPYRDRIGEPVTPMSRVGRKFTTVP
jgi:hypothetical protein